MVCVKLICVGCQPQVWLAVHYTRCQNHLILPLPPDPPHLSFIPKENKFSLLSIYQKSFDVQLSFGFDSHWWESWHKKMGFFWFFPPLAETLSPDSDLTHWCPLEVWYIFIHKQSVVKIKWLENNVNWISWKISVKQNDSIFFSMMLRLQSAEKFILRIVHMSWWSLPSGRSRSSPTQNGQTA